MAEIEGGREGENSKHSPAHAADTRGHWPPAPV